MKVILFSCFLLGLSALAAEVPPQEGEEKNATDRLHESVTRRVIRLSNQIDNFFGEKRALDARNKSSMVLSLSQDFPEGGIPTPRFDAAINLKLINLENIGRDLENSVLGRKFEEINPRATHDDEPVYGPMPEDLPWRLVLDQRVGAKWLPTYSAKLRLSKDFYTGLFFHHFAQDYGWDSENLRTATTSFDSDVDLSDTWLFRWINTGTVFFDKNITTSSHGPSFIHTIDEWRVISYNFRLSTEYLEHRAHYTSGYDINVTYRQDLYEKWIYLQLVPSVSFPRNNGFTRVLNFGFRFELIFGDS
jgi:hypothetical protein